MLTRSESWKEVSVETILPMSNKIADINGINLQVLNIITTHQLRRTFHARTLQNNSDQKLDFSFNPDLRIASGNVEKIQRKTGILHEDNLQSILKYSDYYNRRASASPLAQDADCFLQ